MKIKRFSLLVFPFILIGCNNSSVNTPRSPFNDSYNPIGMTGYYKSKINKISPEDYSALKASITNYNDDEKVGVVKSYTRLVQSRDLKAAYFGKNIGAANLCTLTTQNSTNHRYSNNVTNKFLTSHNERQVANGSIIKTNSTVKDYTYQAGDTTTYRINEQVKNNDESPATSVIKAATYESSEIPTIFGLRPYKDDILDNFKEMEKKGVIFSVLGDNNNAVYGKTNIEDIGDRFLIKEATSLYTTYSTTIGDSYKAVYNYFYECLLDTNYRFTNFRFYTELLILSEAITDVEKVPVLYLEKPQRVEYSEKIYSIEYANTLTETFTKENIPGYDPSPAI